MILDEKIDAHIYDSEKLYLLPGNITANKQSSVEFTSLNRFRAEL